jgi:hypothetical protein
MKPIFILMMICGGLVSAFGINNQGVKVTDDLPVITGGWHEIDNSELDEAIKTFFDDYLKDHPGKIERVWTQLVHGRRFLLAYSVMPMPQDIDVVPSILGLLMLRRDIDGVITLEHDYSHLTLFDFIKLMLTGENKEGEE